MPIDDAMSRILHVDPTVQRWIDAAELLKSSRLQYTRFVPGFFMDYWGMPHVSTHLGDFSWAIDMINRRAALPGDGKPLISLTLSTDLARFMVRMLDEPEWDEFSVVVGSDVSFDEFLSLAEKVRGQ